MTPGVIGGLGTRRRPRVALEQRIRDDETMEVVAGIVAIAGGSLLLLCNRLVADVSARSFDRTPSRTYMLLQRLVVCFIGFAAIVLGFVNIARG